MVKKDVVFRDFLLYAQSLILAPQMRRPPGAISF
jgi:hypothetical protein